MHLYISKDLRNIVSQKEAWRTVNFFRNILATERKELAGGRASLLPISWKSPRPDVTQSAVLVLSKKGGEKRFELYYVLKNGHYKYCGGASTKHLSWVFALHRWPKRLRKLSDPGEFLPPRLKAALRLV